MGLLATWILGLIILLLPTRSLLKFLDEKVIREENYTMEGLNILIISFSILNPKN